MRDLPGPSVALLRDPHEQANWSMKLYADALAAALPGAGVDVEQPVLGRGGTRLHRYLARYVTAPRQAARLSAGVLHVVDHSNAHWLRRLPPARTVVTCHDLILLKAAAGEMPWPALRLAAVARVFRWKVGHLRRASAVVCDSEATRRDAERLAGCDPRRLTVVHPGLHEAFRPAEPAVRAAARGRLGLGDDTALVHVGHSLFYKNVEGIIEALARLPRPWRARATLLKAGGGLTRAQWSLARSRGVAARVRLLGRLPLEELVGLYQAADVLLAPSYDEGFGWPPLEAMACGTPVVCSDRGGLAEAAAGAAMVVRPEDPDDIARGVQRVLEDEGYRRQAIDRGRERAARFDWAGAARRLRGVYEGVLARAGAASGEP